jgi:thiol reductant ABC exporter CydD subunit
MRAVAYDQRLLRVAPATRRFVTACVALGTLSALLVIAQAWLLADVVSGAFVARKGLPELRGVLAALLCVVLARAVVAWSTKVSASRAAVRAKSQLRASLLERTASAGAQEQIPDPGEVATLATRGIDALDAYFSLYLPQVFLAVLVPAGVVAAVATQDWVSATIIALTLPLIPLFMALVGATTRERMDRQLRALQRLASHFLDVVLGLPTLKVFGRAQAQIAAVGEITDRYRRAAIATLRVSFLSSLTLELVSTISVALVAVAIGLRLMAGGLGLHTALFVLVLAPEAYLPVRLLGANYHASAEGLSAAEQVFAHLERPPAATGGRTDVPDPSTRELVVDGLTVARGKRERPTIDGLSLAVDPGETLAITGPSGCGKSTLLGVILGLVAARDGEVRVGGIALHELDPAAWRERLAWVPQRPHLFAGSIGENIRVGRPRASRQEVLDAASAAGLSEVIARKPRGLGAVLGDRGAGLSAGERQRVALARAFLRDAPLLLLDEPTANLDGATEALVLEAVRGLLLGRTTLLVAHRPSLIALADRVYSLQRESVEA